MAKKKVYTRGTLYEKQTGRYADPGLSGNQVQRGTARTKKVGTGTAKAEKGKKIGGAPHGVGQETIDGFANKSPKGLVKTANKNKKNPPRRR